MLEGALRRTSMCKAYYLTFHIRKRNIVLVRSNFLTQISCGIKTKRAAPILFESNRLLLLPCFSASKCSLAKIAIPCTIYPSFILVVLKNKYCESISTCPLISLVL